MDKREPRHERQDHDEDDAFQIDLLLDLIEKQDESMRQLFAKAMNLYVSPTAHGLSGFTSEEERNLRITVTPNNTSTSWRLKRIVHSRVRIYDCGWRRSAEARCRNRTTGETPAKRLGAHRIN